MAILGQHISQDLLKALGLPKQTIGFTLRCRYDEIVTVECEYYADGDFQTALAEYELVNKEPATQLDFDAWHKASKETAHKAFMARSRQVLAIDRRP